MLSCRLRSGLRTTAVLCAGTIGLAGCSYTSEYTPQPDGRARAVWRDNNVVVEPAGAPVTDACLQEAMGQTGTAVIRATRESGYAVRRAEGYWVPRYYGPPIVLMAVGLAPLLPRPPLFLPLLAAGAAARAVGLSAPAPLFNLGGGGGGKDAGYVLVALAVLAVLVLPAVDLGVALAPPESPARSSQAIDQVNALNDLLRTPGSPCSYEALMQQGAP